MLKELHGKAKVMPDSSDTSKAGRDHNKPKSWKLK